MSKIEDQDARAAIDGAIAFGRMGVNEPPAGHWLTEYWSIGRQLAELGKTSAWDNQTPVESRPTPEQSGEARDARNIESYRIWAISEGVTTTTLGYKIWRAAIDAAMDRSALGRGARTHGCGWWSSGGSRHE